MRYCLGRDGNHLVTPFQCVQCIFLNLTQRFPIRHSMTDDLLMCCIQRINLDAMWGRENSTIRSTVQDVNKTIAILAPFGVLPSYPPLGPHPFWDPLGYGAAIAMVLKSMEPGRYANHQQFETIRKLWAGFHNVYMASVMGVASLRAVGGDRAKNFLNQCDTHSTWFEHFAAGCLQRMGQEIRQDRAISLNVMHALLHHLEGEWVAAIDPNARLYIAPLGAYSVIAFCGSFRGPEVFLTDLYGLRKYLDAPRQHQELPHIIIPLLDRLKNENGERYHLMPLCSATSSGLQVETWM
jgi:hypothetical protein